MRLRLFAACLLAMSAQASAIQVIDDAGVRHAFAAPPQRIVSLSPHLTELLFAVGAGPQLAGVDAASDYPGAAQALPRIGDFSRIRFERILALKPDLIVAWVGGNRAADLHGIAQLGIPVLHTEARQLDDVARLLILLGRVTGHDRSGETAARDYRIRLAALKTRYARSPAIPVFYQVWDRPLMSVGGSHWISEALAVCGARNIFSDLEAVAPTVSREAVLRRAPRLVVGGNDAPALRMAWQVYTGLPAVRYGGFAQVNADWLHRASPRLVDGVAELCEAISRYGR